MGKGKGFWFKFNPVDFIGGTDMMTHEQVGAYMRLLCYQFTDKGLLTMKRIKFVLGADYERIWPELKDKFIEVNGNFLNERLAVEMDHMAIIATQNRQNGALGGRPKKTERLLNEKPNGYEKNNRSNSISKSDNSMDEIVDESKVIPMNDDTTRSMSLAENSRANSEAAIIERHFATLFQVTFAQHGKINPSRQAFIREIEIAAKERREPRGLAAEFILGQAAKYRAIVSYKGTPVDYQPHCENWLESGDWRKDYDVLREQAMSQRRTAQNKIDQGFDEEGAPRL